MKYVVLAVAILAITLVVTIGQDDRPAPPQSSIQSSLVASTPRTAIPADVARTLGDGLEAQRMLVQADGMIRRNPILTFDDLPELIEQAKDAYVILGRYDRDALATALRGQGNLESYLGSDQFDADLQTAEALFHYVQEQSRLEEQNPSPLFPEDRPRTTGVMPPLSRVNDPSLILCDRFEIQASRLDDTLTISLATDLPDSASMIVSISRSYREVGSSAVYSLDYFSEKSTVAEWRSPRTFRVDADRWRRSMKAKQREMAALDLGFDVAAINDTVDVSMVVHINQADRRFGHKNANLFGKAVASSGLRTIREEKSIPFPLEETTRRPANGSFDESAFFFNPNRKKSSGKKSSGNRDDTPPAVKAKLPETADFVVGKKGRSFSVSQFPPSNPLSGMRQVRRAPPRAELRIIDSVTQDSVPWVKLECSQFVNLKLWTGWIKRDELHPAVQGN
ncbi:hypothetical protein Mal15_07910 [Stieleria maiorica]|uniref:Uncharacterized protein n=1 Tax=Stieleria maiorica TaxID=2795974 RepID=A0A5B9M6H3_9BACT|nr:hypothetical protein [Stieleria maiorica]QEF96761.1 hypothetical protein Mal15_07910 [Stieleria maiorica]